MPRRVVVSDLIPEPVELELPDGKVVSVPPLGVDDMLTMFQMESALTEDDESWTAAVRAEKQHAALVGIRNFVVDLIRRADPDAFVSESGEVEIPNWPAQTSMGILGAISGNDSVAEAVREAVVGTAEEIARATEEARIEREEAIARGEEPPEDPTRTEAASTPPSPEPSSASANGTAGHPNGGEDSPGRPSLPISDTPATSTT
jgi:hypothetical protein